MRSLRVKIVTYFCALSLAFQSKGEAWPTEMRGCGLDAHPSTARGGHGTPQSTNTKVYVSWANRNASHVINESENDPNRKISSDLKLASLEYCSGCRMVVSIEHEVKGVQFLVTSSLGTFFEQGAYLNGANLILDQILLLCQDKI